jgi:hypothetical protein
MRTAFASLAVFPSALATPAAAGAAMAGDAAALGAGRSLLAGYALEEDRDLTRVGIGMMSVRGLTIAPVRGN